MKSPLLSILFVVLFYSSICLASDSFQPLDEIVHDKSISYKEAIPEIDSFFNNINSPKQILDIIVSASKKAGNYYSWEQRKIFERYDEAASIGICKLVKLKSDESISNLVELLSLKLSAANRDILLQRITEAGQPALKYLRKKHETEKSKISSKHRLKRIHELIDYIEKGTILNQGVEVCK